MTPNGNGGEVLTVAEIGSRGIGARIKALRAERGWSARELAERSAAAGVEFLSRSAISKLETGQRKYLKPDEARALAEAFEVTIDYLMSGEQVVPPAGDRGRSRAGTAQSAMGEEPELDDAGPGLSEVRRAELDQILNWLDRGREPYALLVLGPPGIGKSVLASQLAREAPQADAGWVPILFDVREVEPGERQDAETLVPRIFGLEAPERDEPDAGKRASADAPAPLRIAQRISKAGRPVLCVLDSADELTEETTTRLRAAFDDIHDNLRQTGNPKARLALIVMSRLDQGWRSAYHSRLGLIALSEFGTDVIQDKLREAAGPERRSEYSVRRFAELASAVYAMTAGLPPLLAPCLSWIADQQWVGIDQLEDPAVFEDLASTYIGILLAPQTLFPRAVKPPPEQLEVLRTAIGFLVRYRFFTRSHLRHHLENDDAFKESLKRSGWQADDLWVALSGVALLNKPLDDVWQEFHPAIRRLLFRHAYPSPAKRALAHREAKTYVAEWASRQRDKDQVAGRVEELWHVVSELRLEKAPNLRERLLAAVREAGTRLDETEAYSLADLSAYAGERIARDAEFQAAVGDTALAVEVSDIVRMWART